MVERALRRVYSENFDPKGEIEENLFSHTWKTLNKATDEGFGKIEFGHPDFEFLQEIKYNNAVFAAFKTHRQQNDLFAQLTDKEGVPKSFAQFKKDTAPIIGQYNVNWLQTEYNTAIIRARGAVQWKQFEREKHIYPNLKWLPSMAAIPREEHKPFYNRVWAQTDPFWKSHRPGDKWGCKCGLTSTNEPVTDSVIPKTDMPEPSPGLDNNPAEDGKLFSDTHPYVQQATHGAKKTVQKFITKNVAQPETYTSKNYKSGGELQLPNHGKQNKQEERKNKKAYEELAEKHGERYRLLPVDDSSGKKNPDAFNLKTGKYSDVKVPTSDNGKNAIQTSIKDASKQRVCEVYIYLEKEYPMKEIREGLKAALQPGRCADIETIIIRLENGDIKRYEANKLRETFYKNTQRKN